MDIRKIKFRGKDYETGEWTQGHFFQRLGHYPAIIEPRPHNGKVIYVETAVRDETVGQFTGMLDKNGKEIYEGDILRLGNSPSGVCEVKWNETMAAFCIQFFFERKLGTRILGEWLIYEKEVEVIGNIHDNPELMKIE